MPSVHEVPADALIQRVAEQLRRVPQISPPSWTSFAKTGSHTERPPEGSDWWYVRCASLLRKLYLHSPIGVSELRSSYGGRRQRGMALAHRREAGGSAVRKPLQQLEAAGFAVRQGKKGRLLSGRGISLLDKTSNTIFKELVKARPLLARYT